MSSPEASSSYPADHLDIVPHMRIYDTVPLHFQAYVTMATRPDFHSTVLNTDVNSFRLSLWRETIVHTANWEALQIANFVLGGSFAFGVGASSDRSTIPSLLAARTDLPFLNLGIRSANSTQELIAALPFMHAARRLILCSGVNNLFLALRTISDEYLFGPVFHQATLNRVSSVSIFQLADLLEGKLGARMPAPGQSVGPAAALRALQKWRSRRPSGGPPPIERAVEMAAARHARDLRVLARGAPDSCQVLFCLQPFIYVPGHQFTAEERQLIHILEEDQGDAWRRTLDQIISLWPSYAAALHDACRQLGVRFVNLSSDRFRGWSFVDSVHLTDLGYAQVADSIAELIA